MAITLGVHNITFGNGINANIFLTPTAGSAMVLCWAGNNARSITFSDSYGSSYTTTDIAGGSQDMAIGYAMNVTGGFSVFSFNNGGAATDYTFWAMEFPGVKTSGAGDGNNDQLDSADPHHTGSITTTGNGVVIGLLTGGGVARTYTLAAGWNLVDKDEVTSSGVGGVVMYQITTATAWNPQTNAGAGFLQGMSLALLADTAAARRFLLVRR